jgi:hypothetical protein
MKILSFWEGVRWERMKRTGQYLDDWDIQVRKHGYKEIIDKRKEALKK